MIDLNKEKEEQNNKQDDQNLALKNALNNFKKIVERKTAEQEQEKTIQENIKKEKKEVLIPIRNLFRRFIEMGLVVKNARIYAPLQNQRNIDNTETNNVVFFDFKKRDTVGQHSPGIDLIVEHPCFINITVLNKGDNRGLIFISTSDTKCPYVDEIKNKYFKDVDSALIALSNFFAKNAVDIVNER